MNKDEFVEKAKETIDLQQDKLDQLKKKAEHASSEFLADIHKMIDDLEPKIEQAKTKFEEITEVADDQWDDLKDAMEKGWDETKSMLDTGWDNLTDTMNEFFSRETKDEFLQKAQEVLDVQQEKLDQLKQKLEEGADDLVEDIQKRVDDLEPQIEKAKAKIAEISDVADHRWEYMRSSAGNWRDEVNKMFDEGWDSITDAVKKLFS